MNKKLNTGQSYTLSQLLSGEHTKIIIPDLQRDYCWGGKGNLVQEFVKNLIVKGFNKDRTQLPLGLLYGYEEPQGHIQLCDGQQRITTLFLLIGLLNRKYNNQFKSLLISDFELNEDDKEPYLQYSIRENSLYFISDLVCNFFLRPECELSKINQESWYFNDYNNDPSIKSMLAALSEIECVLNEYSDIYSDIEFVKYITQDISFMYYDMQTRSSGEETFVIINTTGEPLSPTENLKPRYVTQYESSAEMWEKWEQWFWINRDKKVNDTADSGLLEFFRWIILLETDSTKVFEETQRTLVKQDEESKFDFELVLKIEPKIIDKYFEIVKQLFANILPNNQGWLSPNIINSQVDWFRILPLIAYMEKYPDASDREKIRVKHFFKNLTQISNITKDIANLLSHAVELIWMMEDVDIAKIRSSSERLLTEEEKLKFSIFLETENREEIEDALWAIQYRKDEKQDGKIWNGEILPILKWSFVDERFDFDEFKRYNKVFFEVFEGKCESNIDLTRRALITRELADYPKYFRGKTNKSFGWEYNDWKVLIAENSAKFQEFFKALIDSELPVKETLKMMCDDFPVERKWSEYVHISELLEYCTEKNIQWWEDKYGWVLVKNRDTRGDHANVNAYKLYLELLSLQHKFWDETIYKLWFWEKGSTCIVFDNHNSNLAIDIICVGKDGMFDIEVFVRNDEENNLVALKDYSQRNNLIFNGSRYVVNQLNKQEVIEKLKSLL